jgi:hypothetical protein
MNYEAMMSHEINIEVYKAVKGFSKALPDYCNNPLDSWPIILNNQISIMQDGWTNNIADWIAHSTKKKKDFSSENANPLRAAMIVFLKMHNTN